VKVDPDAPVQGRPRVDEQAGHRAADVYLAVGYGHDDRAAVGRRLRVDVRGKFPELRAWR
jgi:hypothetical protein